MDGLTNILLMVLIALIAYISKVIYEKVENILKRIEQILLADVSQQKDIEQLKFDRSDHEERLEIIEGRGSNAKQMRDHETRLANIEKHNTEKDK